jgi:glycopeptide antibiotics resistance protein
MDSPRTRRWAWFALGLILVVVVTITFWPTPVDRPFRGALVRILASLHGHGMPGWITYSFVESASNVVMFVPLGALIAILALPSLWWTSAVFGFLASLIIEFGQMELLPQRVASAADVAANTAGALLGGVVICTLRYALRRRSRHI